MILDSLISDTIVKILGIGLTGFGFLLMYLAYLLIRGILNQSNPAVLTVRTIWFYMSLCFFMTVAIAVFTYISAQYKNDTIAYQASQLQKTQDASTVLLANQKTQSVADKVKEAASNNDQSVIAVAKREQNQYLDTLIHVAEKTNDTASHLQLAKLKHNLSTLSDSLLMADISNERKENLFLRYDSLTDKVNAVSIQTYKHILANPKQAY